MEGYIVRSTRRRSATILTYYFNSPEIVGIITLVISSSVKENRQTLKYQDK